MVNTNRTSFVKHPPPYIAYASDNVEGKVTEVAASKDIPLELFPESKSAPHDTMKCKRRKIE
eukprot:CAMPEP_0185023044 /NCGR_PEP_ID=MMETSP1103-20130426/5741_1 /TAXON_ID=36769 /ORGANISM="Paraphysomonas bandaiensis, Strain Caron Lab Isolate" /LENGTH=61 /DNA_ID=CAMNT_0027555433 /DNA_START=178 /DNA_END=363 /DNA_ORIENTATION=+